MYLLWYVIILLLPLGILLKVAILITMPLFGLMSFDYWDSIKKARMKLRYILLRKQKNNVLLNARVLHDEIIEWLSGKISR
jgi:hypothetical protein